MIKKNPHPRLFYIILFLIIIVSFFVVNSSMYVESNIAVKNNAETISFQEYLWENHELDLFIQLSLLLAGAFGVAALLPAADEE